MLHVVFSPADSGVLRKAMETEPTLAGDILELQEEWNTGPLAELDTDEGWEARQAWKRQTLDQASSESAAADSSSDREKVKQLIRELTAQPEHTVWIWMGQNALDVTGYYWIMSQLKAFQGRVWIIFMNNLPCINEKGQLFFPTQIGELQPREIIKARKLARPITLSEFEVDPDEWTRLAVENAGVRILEGGKKIVGKEYTYYDTELLKSLTPDWQKATRVVTHTRHRMKGKTSDRFLLWRIRELMSLGRFAVNGDLSKGWKDVELRIPQAEQLELTPVQPG
ncbi:MAG: DUF3658 domain-containing protein [Chitinophagaceae bacterium]